MPDNTKNFSIDEANAPVGLTTVTRAQMINIIEHLNYRAGNVRTVDEVSAPGLLYLDGIGGGGVRTLAANHGLSWTNGDGVSGAPTIGLNQPNTFRNQLHDFSNNQTDDSKLIAVITSGTAYVLEAPTAGSIRYKRVINTTSAVVTITSADWGDPGRSSVRIAPYDAMDFVSNTVGKWFVVQLASVLPAMGKIYTTSAAATVLPDAATYVEDPSTTAAGSVMHQFDQPANGRLRYTGKMPVHAHIDATLSVTTAANGDVVHHRVVHYDDSLATATELADSEVIQKSQASGGDTLSTALHADVVMEENDYLYVATRNAGWSNAADTVTIEKKYLFAMGVRRALT